MKKTKLFAIPVLLLGLLAMGYAGYQLLETRQTNIKADSSYEDMSNMVRKTPIDGNPPLPNHGTSDIEGIIENDSETKINIPRFEIDFNALRSINNDSVAWLYSPGTVIDYPVMKAGDYSYYLNHLADGTVNANGSLFIDYNNAPDFSDNLTVIYGHHMKSGSMFGSLVEYKNQNYFDNNPYMYLYTEHGDYRIDIMYGCVIGAGQWRERAFMYSESIEALLAYSKQNTTFHSSVEYQEDDKIVVLSTCSYEFDDARYFLVGVLRA